MKTTAAILTIRATYPCFPSRAHFNIKIAGRKRGTERYCRKGRRKKDNGKSELMKYRGINSEEDRKKKRTSGPNFTENKDMEEKEVEKENWRNRKSNRENRGAKFKSVCLQRVCHSMYVNHKILIKHRVYETPGFSEISCKPVLINYS